MLTASAITGKGILEIWETVEKFLANVKSSGFFNERRKFQTVEWMLTMIESSLKHNFYSNKKISGSLSSIKKQVLSGDILPTIAAEKLLKIFYMSFSDE